GIQDSTSNADLQPVYQNGKWVNPVTKKPVPDQSYWNNNPPVGTGSVNPSTKSPSYLTQPSTANMTAQSARYSQRDVYKLLLANGVPPEVATRLAIISARGEDPSGDPRALNNNPRTGDYSVGLFQENFLGKMGVARVRQFAPQFGLSPNMPVKDFVSWLGDHPAAQAQIAYQIYQSQGYGAWTTATRLGITGGGGLDPYGPNPFATPGAFTKNTGSSKPKKPSIAKPSQVQAAANALGTDRGEIGSLGIRNIATDLGKQAGEIGKELAAKTITTENLATIRQKLQALKQEIADGIRQTADLVKATKLGREVANAVADGLLPPELGKTIEARLAELEAKLSSGRLSDGARKKIEAQMASLGEAYKLGLERALAVTNFDKAISSFLAGLEGLTPKVDAELKRLGIAATTLITPEQMASLEKQAAQLKSVLLGPKLGLSANDVEKLKS